MESGQIKEDWDTIVTCLFLSLTSNHWPKSTSNAWFYLFNLLCLQPTNISQASIMWQCTYIQSLKCNFLSVILLPSSSFEYIDSLSFIDLLNYTVFLYCKLISDIAFSEVVSLISCPIFSVIWIFIPRWLILTTFFLWWGICLCFCLQ